MAWNVLLDDIFWGGGGRWVEFDSFLPSQWGYRKECDFGIRLPLVPSSLLMIWVTSGKLFKLSKP